MTLQLMSSRDEGMMEEAIHDRVAERPKALRLTKIFSEP